jgi:hypothetical protein
MHCLRQRTARAADYPLCRAAAGTAPGGARLLFRTREDRDLDRESSRETCGDRGRLYGA